MKTIINKNDEIIMSLVHYFVTEENYTPIVVRGVENEIWLENIEGPYKIIRINSNYIHNDEQFNFDLFKTDSVLKQIKKKTLSWKMNVLNIFTNVSNYVKLEDKNNIDAIYLKNIKDFKDNNKVMNAFPDIVEKTSTEKSGLDFVFAVTDDINKKTAEENKNYEKVFKPKKILITYILMALCFIMFMVSLFVSNGKFDAYSLALLGGNFKDAILKGEVYRLITSAFLHGGYIHFLVNMYSLYIIGKSLETFLGKWKFLVIYLVSAITGSMLSCIFASNDFMVSIGASGAIFGLLGAILYFGYNYRLYLGSVLKTQIIPIIAINLFIGFAVDGIDNACHIGGLIGGYLSLKALGVPNKSDKGDKTQGIILLLIYLIFLIYTLFFR